MLFSIVVPIYNVEKYLNECLSSIKRQTYKEFECVLVDDGSTDQSGKICDVYAKEDARFKVLHKSNGGHTSARIAGAEVASGDYIISIDGDDWVDDRLLETLSEAIIVNNPDSVCFGMTTFGGGISKPIVNACGSGLYSAERLKKIEEGYLYCEDMEGINSGTLLFNICTKCVRRELYMYCQGQVSNEIVSGEDTVFSMCWIKEAKKICVLEYAGYYYRQHPMSIEHQFEVNRITGLLKTCQALHGQTKGDRRKENAVCVYKFYRLWFYLCGKAICTTSYKEYMMFIKKAGLINEIRNLRFDIKKKNIQSVVKIFLVKHKLWCCIFWISKLYFKRKVVY